MVQDIKNKKILEKSQNCGKSKIRLYLYFHIYEVRNAYIFCVIYTFIEFVLIISISVFDKFNAFETVLIKLKFVIIIPNFINEYITQNIYAFLTSYI